MNGPSPTLKRRGSGWGALWRHPARPTLAIILADPLAVRSLRFWNLGTAGASSALNQDTVTEGRDRPRSPTFLPSLRLAFFVMAAFSSSDNPIGKGLPPLSTALKTSPKSEAYNHRPSQGITP